MKNYIINLALLIPFSLVLLISCSNNDDTTPNEGSHNESLLDPVDEELNSMLASIPSDTNIQIVDLKFDDGSIVLDFIPQYDPDFVTEHNVQGMITKNSLTNSLTPEDQKKLLIVRMEIMAHSLVDRNKWSNYQGSDQPNGLAYLWGGKNHLELNK